MKFIANRAGNLQQSLESAGCVDNFRDTEVVDDENVNPQYQVAVDNGCCGSSDYLYNNPVTGKNFRIGFNYGH